METLLSPEGGLAAVLAASFLAATIVPLSSEAVLFGYLKLHPDHAALAVALATLGNTAGGMTTYLIGRLFPDKGKFIEQNFIFFRCGYIRKNQENTEVMISEP